MKMVNNDYMNQGQASRQSMQSEGIARAIGQSYVGEGAKLAEQQRQPEIQAHVQDLFKSLAAFDMVLGELYKKLTPVSRTDPEKDTANTTLRGSNTELGGQLSDLCTRMNNMRNYAQQVTGRIEL